MNATTGMALVAALKAITTGLVPVTIKSGLRATMSLAPNPHSVLMMPFSGIAFDAEILSLDVTEPAQLSENARHALPPPVS